MIETGYASDVKLNLFDVSDPRGDSQLFANEQDWQYVGFLSGPRFGLARSRL